MFVVEIIPLMRGSSVGKLSYYSSIAYPSGSLVMVPVRNKEVPGLVVQCNPVSAAKTAVRAATFSLKKLPAQTDNRSLPPLLVETARSLTSQVPATLGSILYAMLPEEVRTGEEVLQSDLPCLNINELVEVSVLAAEMSERFRTYRGRIREAFAHRGSVLFVVPTAAAVAPLVEELSTGIAERVVTFSPEYGEKKLHKSYESLHDLSIPKLIVVTPSHAFVDRPDIQDIIIEESRSPYYKMRTRPYLDIRNTLITMSKLSGRRVLLGDLTPRVEDEYYRRGDIYATEGEYPKRIAFPGTLKIVKQKDKPTAEQPFRLFSKELLSGIEEAIALRRNVFLYSARRGLAPVVACGDCGHIFRCPDSGTPYSLFRTMKDGEEKRWFLSSTSGRRVKAADTCPQCGSWRLRERGVGIQQVFDELAGYFPMDQIFLFDHSTANTPRKVRQIISGFYDKKGAILVGTAMAIPYLEKPVALSAVVSLDAVRSVPTWRADEETFALLMKLREISTDVCIIQTRTEPDAVIEAAKTGQLEKFYDEELALRQSLHYPPFSQFVHLTISGPADSLREVEQKLSEQLSEFGVAFYSAPDSTPKKTIRHGLVRVSVTHWPDKELLDALRVLPPSVRIEINPGRIV